MKIDLLTAEIGSTTTVVHGFHALDSLRPRIIGQGRALTTVTEGDVGIGLHRAWQHLAEQVGVDSLEASMYTSASSAAGGLRMSVHGLAYEMTARAAKEAALGAGAVVKMVTAGKLNPRQVEQIMELKPNLIFLAGGIDYGDEEVPWHNVQALAEALDRHRLKLPIIYAGNKALQESVEKYLGERNLPVFLCDNVYPRIDQLVVEPARRVIQEVFEKHIVTAPGLEKVRQRWGTSLWPTPAAVMQSTRLFASRCGDAVVIDVGGATTDVHSVTEGSPEVQDIAVAPEPKAKRTVEGDLGVFISSRHVLPYIGDGKDGEGVTPDAEAIPETAAQRQWVLRLAEAAAHQALLRHVGRFSYAYTGSGRQRTAQGRDLTAVQFLIGTGGVFAHLDPTGTTLQRCLDGDPDLLLPRGAKILTDRRYIMAAMGTIAQNYPEEAWHVLQKSLGSP